MKNTFMPLCILIMTNAGFAQSFNKGNRNFDMKLDFAGYGGTVQNNQTREETKSGSASIIFTPQMTWGMGKKISIGASLAYSHYLDSSQSTPSIKPRLNGLDANFLFDFHFLRRSKTDMMIGLKLGIAGIRYNPNDGTGDIYGSMGSTSDIHFVSRFYISENMGIIVALGFPRYRFNKFGKNLDYTYTVNSNGIYIGTGLAINLTTKKVSAPAPTQ